MKNGLLFSLATIVASLGFARDVVLDGPDATVTFGADGSLAKLVEKASGRNLLSAPAPWVAAVDAAGRARHPKSLAERAPGELVFTFADGQRLVQKVAATDFGLVFTVVESSVAGAESLTLASVRPACTNFVGVMANALSDDRSAVSLRAFDYESAMLAAKGIALVKIPGRFDPVGKRVALLAGPRAGFIEKERRAVKASGLFYSEAGGPWSLGSPQTRQSYMFANMFGKSADAWIDAALRAGVSILHFHSWHDTLGHYDVNPAKYPGGIPAMKAVAEKARAAGLSISMHTLTACIDFRDPWVTPVAHSNLVATYVYTLAAPLDTASKEILVNELPGPKHDVVMTYTSNGNVIEIDGELVSYTGVRREKPYAFTGIGRGAYKTRVKDHPAGARAKYLQQRYFSFYPEVDSPLADELADRLAAVYNGIGADMLYLDGSEGMKDPYATAKMAAKIGARLDKSRHPPRMEMSCKSAHFWPFRSTIGAWDNVLYGAQSFEDAHIRVNDADGKDSNFMETQMGWWRPQLAARAWRCRFPDETEYFAAKNAGRDTAMSLQGLDANRGYLPDHQEKALTLIGWYERFRLAQAFAEPVAKELATLGREGRLEQDDEGAWTYTPVRTEAHRVKGDGVGDRWTVETEKGGAADLRVETFYNLSDYASPAARGVFGPDSVAAFKPSSAKGVTAEAKRADDPERGAVVRLTASNDSGSRRGAWAGFERRFAGPDYLSLEGSAGIGFWVKGDGSGAILDVQLQNPREYSSACRADHLVKLDFKGWKYVELLFRERDIEEYVKYKWPQKVDHPEWMCSLREKFVWAVRIYLNEIPLSAAEGVLDANSETAASRPPSVDIALSEVKALALKETTNEEIVLKLNGEKIAVPFEFAAGDWAELKAGRWAHYDENGGFKGCAAGPSVALKAGANACAYSAKASDRAAARAEVTLAVRGERMPALKELTDEMRAGLKWEAEMPVVWAPAKGAATLPPVKVRPGEEAKLSVKVRGPVKDAVLKVKKFFGWHEWTLGTVKEGEVRTFADGPEVDGVREVRLESSDPSSADALVEIVKHYKD